MSNDHFSQDPLDPAAWGGDPTMGPPGYGAAPVGSAGEPAPPVHPEGPTDAGQGYQQPGYSPQAPPPIPGQYGSPAQAAFPPADQYGQAPSPQTQQNVPAVDPPGAQAQPPPEPTIVPGQHPTAPQSAPPQPGFPPGGPGPLAGFPQPGPQQPGFPPAGPPQQGPPQPGPQPGFPPGDPQPSPFGQAPAANYPTGGGFGYQSGPPAGPMGPGYGQGFGGQPPAKSNGKRVALIAIPVALVLAVVGYLYATRDGDTPVGVPSASTSAKPGASASEQPSPSPTDASSAPADGEDGTAKAPGPGTTESVLAYLESKDFVCSDEGNKAIVSKYCTHFGGETAMAAYVGGRTDGSLGRLTLEVQMETPDSLSQATSKWVMQQFVGDEAAVAAITADIATGTTKDWAKGTQGEVHYRGNKRGTVVMYVNDWEPAGLKAAVIETSVSDLSQYVISKGYSCAAGTQRGSQRCTREANGYEFITFMIPDSSKKFIKYASVIVKRDDPQANLPAVVKSETTMFLNGMGQQAAPWKAYIYDADGQIGDIQFVGGMVADWFPGGSASSTSGALYLQPPCWQNFVTDC